jgi:membrane-bound lytic murein transglycosylase D
VLLGVFAIKNSSLISFFILSTVLISSCSLLPKISSVNGIEESAPLLDATPASPIDLLSEEHLVPTEHQVTEELLSTPEEPVAASEPEDLWKRIRSGYQLDLDNLPDAVTKQRQWYINNPSYLKAVFSRAEPFIYYITDQLEQAGR